MEEMEWDGGEQISSSNIEKIQDYWGVKLPPQFTKIILENNRACSDYKDVFDTEKSKGRVFAGLLNFDLSAINNVLSDYESIKDILGNKTFPFAEDPSGNFICFSFGSSENNEPKVVLWLHEGIIKNGTEYYVTEFIADSFEEFLSKLYEGNDNIGDIDLSKAQYDF